ncbi:hypothetical protein WG66_006245 [Moniliophthora roreri]|uniref:Uncharacterized protein n=1 Tax=Moniliophthora roreri TaxID=221103 RepID=A0A0W0G8Y9_MONRR|nr:hypothetical protein WG66_006245 [Moniliophthora roreri]
MLPAIYIKNDHNRRTSVFFNGKNIMSYSDRPTVSKVLDALRDYSRNSMQESMSSSYRNIYPSPGPNPSSSDPLKPLKPDPNPNPNPEQEEQLKNKFESSTGRSVDIAVIRYALSWFPRPVYAAEYIKGVLKFRGWPGYQSCVGMRMLGWDKVPVEDTQRCVDTTTIITTTTPSNDPIIGTLPFMSPDILDPTQSPILRNFHEDVNVEVYPQDAIHDIYALLYVLAYVQVDHDLLHWRRLFDSQVTLNRQIDHKYALLMIPRYFWDFIPRPWQEVVRLWSDLLVAGFGWRAVEMYYLHVLVLDILDEKIKSLGCGAG